MYLHINTKNKAIHIHICFYKYPKQKPYQAPTNLHILLRFPLSAVQSFSLSPTPHSTTTHLSPPFPFCHNVHASEEHQAIANPNVSMKALLNLDPDPRTPFLLPGVWFSDGREVQIQYLGGADTDTPPLHGGHFRRVRKEKGFADWQIGALDGWIVRGIPIQSTVWWQLSNLFCFREKWTSTSCSTVMGR